VGVSQGFYEFCGVTALAAEPPSRSGCSRFRFRFIATLRFATLRALRIPNAEKQL